MSINEGGRVSATSSGRGSLYSSDSQRLQLSRQPELPSGTELYRENATAIKQCEENCGYCQLQCPNCSSYAVLSVQRIDGKVHQVWTILDKPSVSKSSTIENNRLRYNTGVKPDVSQAEFSNQNSNELLLNVATLSSRRAIQLTPYKSNADLDASAPPLSRPQSSDSGLFDLSEGRPVPFAKRLCIESIAKYSYSLSQANKNNRVSPSNLSEMSDADENSSRKSSANSMRPSSVREDSPIVKEMNNNPIEGGYDLSPTPADIVTIPEEPAEEQEVQRQTEKIRVTNPFEDGYEEPNQGSPKNLSNSESISKNPFDEEDQNPFNTESPTSSSSIPRLSSSKSRQSVSSPSTRQCSNILDVRKLIHPDKVFPMDTHDPLIATENGMFDPEASFRQPSIVSSTGPTVFSKTAQLLKHVLIGAAVVILVGVLAMFVASLSKSMMR
ncbi:uncharacterized protein LOC108665037 [Hyalella azteca]|uniref:Uncharacterized protein LOC108665037 n=1 Tax=Hyalella azteca TaxID=294128 RepID=A0A8B7N118_HYAAZ|nr:uncharacterized protein LOC108665037 [Hyalella azteca]